MKVETVDFVTIPTRDVERAAGWYREVLGLEPGASGEVEAPNESFSGGEAAAAAPSSMVALDVAAEAVVTETGIEITRAPAEIRFEPLQESHELLGSLVGWQDDKFAAHNAAAWQNGLLVHVPGGLELEQPLFVPVVNAIEDGSLFWRLLIVAEAGSGFPLVVEQASGSGGLPGH